MLERYKGMSPDEQTAFVARMKERGMDTSAFAAAVPAAGGKKPAQPSKGAQTIDALFAPLPVIETRGRAWLFVDHQLKSVNLRLGITDGTNTELIGGELTEGMDVVTAVTGLGTTRALPGQTGSGNPLIPGGGRGGPGGFGGGAPGRGR